MLANLYTGARGSSKEATRQPSHGFSIRVKASTGESDHCCFEAKRQSRSGVENVFTEWGIWDRCQLPSFADHVESDYGIRHHLGP